MTALQKFGETLVTLTERQLSKLSIPDGLRTALAEAKGLRKNEAKRRQMQYIGRLMREIDAADLERLRSRCFRLYGKIK